MRYLNLTRAVMRASLLLCLCAMLTLAGMAQAQVAGTPDYDKWNTLAKRAEQVVEVGRASDDSLEDLRTSITSWRETFLQAQSGNTPRIDALQSQLDALGAAPEDGTEEDPQIAERRADLTNQLNRLKAPQRQAEEAYTRADGLVSAVDEIIRTRAADELLELNETPLNPALWPAAANASMNAIRSVWQEMRRNAASPAKLAEMRQNTPAIALLLLLAAVLVARGPHWVRKLGDRLRRRTRRGTGVWRFLVSLGGILIPIGGLVALVAALESTGLPGVNGERILDKVPAWGAILLVIRWLADQSFNRDDMVATLPLRPTQRTEAWLYSTVLAFLFVMRSVGDTIGDIYSFSTETSIVLDFPILVLCALMLFRLGHILAGISSTESADPGEETAGQDEDSTLLENSQFRLQIVRIVGRGAMILAVTGPIMSAIGYDKVGVTMVYPAILTLALLALVLVFQRFFNDLYQLVTGRSAEESDSLIPVLAGFTLMMAALPVLALVWGARVADLTELWARFRAGFAVGDTRISPTGFLTMVVVFMIGYLLTRLLQGGMRSSILPKTKLDIGGQNALISGIGYTGIIIAAVVAITSAGIDLTALGYVAGALSVGIGFGLQNIVSNFVSGIILLIERPISEGDWIEVGGNMGIVKDISVRSTRIETFDRTDVIVPNSDFVSGTVTNYTRGNVVGRVYIKIGVAYGSDTHQVQDILLKIAREHDMVFLNPEPSVVFAGFGADSLDFEVRAIVRDVGHKLTITSEMNHLIAERFAEAGIEIPFAQRDVWLRNPEALVPRSAPAAAPNTEAEAKAPDAAEIDARTAPGDQTVMPAGRAGDADDND